jgi:hypothetical protein
VAHFRIPISLLIISTMFFVSHLSKLYVLYCCTVKVPTLSAIYFRVERKHKVSVLPRDMSESRMIGCSAMFHAVFLSKVNVMILDCAFSYPRHYLMKM